MSSQFNAENNHHELKNSQGKVRVTDLLSRLNEEKKVEKKVLNFDFGLLHFGLPKPSKNL